MGSMKHKLTGLALLGAVLLTTAACSGEESDTDTDAKPKAEVPAYQIVQQDDSGNSRQITVEVDSTKNLRAVFDDVVTKLDDEAGYWVSINCSTGGTEKVDNRLANGKHAVGNMGSAATGLDEGQSEFSTNKGRTCPA